jgi:uncharacterized protein (DUF1778 family)
MEQDELLRIDLRVPAADKAAIMRAVAIAQTDLSSFILSAALIEAFSILEEQSHFKFTERDSRLVLELLDNQPKPNAKLRSRPCNAPSLVRQCLVSRR